MMKNIFQFKEYRAYLLHKISQLPRNGRGARLAIANTVGCPVSHISQVLTGVSNLSYEQAELINIFFGHTDEEADFFLLLVQYSRAGSRELKSRLNKKILSSLEKRLVLKDRLGVSAEISPQDQTTFYSSWVYGAIHMLVSIPKFNSREAIAQELGLSIKYTGEILEFLISTGLVVQNEKGYSIGKSRIHLGNESPLISKFHTNWRVKAIEAYAKENFKNNLHYSSVITISESDFLKIKSMLVEYISEIKAVIRDSKEEAMYCFSLDLFDL